MTSLGAQNFPDKQLSRIAFGSCAHHQKPQPILLKVVAKKPDLFIYLGDNIYGDTDDMAVLKEKYQMLGAKPEFQELQKSTQILATWDDHDFGDNDIGKRYCCKEASKEIFLDFWKEPMDSERRRHPGIYHSHTFGQGEHIVQVILLDTRTFRDDLLPNDKKKPHKNDYRPNPSPDSTFLGQAQWAWLEEQFKQPAALRIIASSNQFSHEYNGWESWTNVPREQEKMMELIKKTKANGVVFLSGDVHWGEISKRPVEGSYPLYDVTSSGLTQEWPTVEANKYRVGGVYRNNNFGMIEIDWAKSEFHLQLHDYNGVRVVHHKVHFSEVRY